MNYETAAQVVNEVNASTIRHAIELALRRGSYTAREVAMLREAADTILLAELGQALESV